MLSEKTVREALKAISWPRLEAHVATVPEVDGSKLVELIRTDEALIFKHPGKTDSRDELLARSAEYLRSVGQRESAEALDQYVCDLRIIERGFAEILRSVEDGPCNDMDGAMRVSAALELATREYSFLNKQLADAYSSEAPTFPNPMLEAPSGRKIDAEVALCALLEVVKNTVMMEAYREQWFGPEGRVRVPRLNQVADADVERIVAYSVCANSWRNWDGAQLGVRFRGTTIRQLDAAELVDAPGGDLAMAENYAGYALELDGASQFLDFCANERLMDRIRGDLIKISGAFADKPLRNAGRDKLPPETFLSEDELLAVVSMDHLLSIDLAASTQHFSGLRLVEWIRGYAALRDLVRRDIGESHGEIFWLKYARPDLVSELTASGLTVEKALAFIGNITFNRSSRDLFDHPLIEVGEDELLVVTGSVLTSLISQVVLSAVASNARMHKDETAQVAGKGDGFEKRILDLLTDARLDPKHPKVHRDGQEYQFDALFVWGDYLFVFECKNRSLSFNHPVAAHYFEMECKSNAKQVLRLADALVKYPDILEEHLPEGIGKTVVPCVMHALPYAIPGGLDGALFGDESALSKFFKQPVAGLRDPRSEAYLVSLRLWEGAVPTAEDLVFALEHPFQVYLMAGQIEVSAAPTPMGPRMGAYCQYLQRETIDPEKLKASIAQFEALRTKRV